MKTEDTKILIDYLLKEKDSLAKLFIRTTSEIENLITQLECDLKQMNKNEEYKNNLKGNN